MPSNAGRAKENEVWQAMSNGFHAVNGGSNPPGDAKFRYNQECQGVKSLGILCFFLPIWFPEVHLRSVASTLFVGIFVGINLVR